MKKSILISAIALLLLSCSAILNAQQGVSINITGAKADSSAMLDVSSTNKGFILPRMTTGERNAIVSPASGLTIFNTDCNVFNFNSGTPSAPVWSVVYSSNSVNAGVSIYANPSGAICSGTSVSFVAYALNGGTSPAYQWKKGSSIITGATESTYTSSTLANSDTITCVLTSNQYCVSGSPATSNMIIMMVYPIVASGVSINVNPTGSICLGTSVTFTATPSNGGASPTWQWKKGGADITGETNSVYTSANLANNDEITCVMTSSQPCVTGNPATSNIIKMSVLGYPGTQTFSYTGSQQTFTVPDCITSLSLDVYGAQGGDAGGGLGGRALGTIAVTPGQTLYIYVGGKGWVTGGGWNGGGASSNAVGGGGGASDVRIGGTTFNDRIIVGGGGGGGYYSTGGGVGGGLTGGNGTSVFGGGYPTGGTQAAGGNCYGAFGTGGSGPWNATGSGGGGGWYGGGSNGCLFGNNSSGAGGSGYIGGVTGGSMQSGVRSGDGQIIVSW